MLKDLADKKLKMADAFLFEIKSAKKDKSFKFFKGPFLRIRWPYGCNFWRVSEIYVRLIKSQDIATVITI